MSYTWSLPVRRRILVTSNINGKDSVILDDRYFLTIDRGADG